MSTAQRRRAAGGEGFHAAGRHTRAAEVVARGAGRHVAVSSVRAHLHELDMLRVVTAFSVVTVHVLAFTVIYTAATGALIQHGAESAMHFTRSVFMFTTALVLTYTYVGKRFNLALFSRKRFIGVVVPYTLWSMIYILHGPHPSAPLALLGTTVHDLITGTASFQLYYILLTIQFYILFPVFLWLLPRLDRYRWVVLGLVGALQLVMLVVDYAFVQRNPFASTPVGSFINTYQGTFVLMYPFYFVLGGICALHLPRIRESTLRHGKLIGAIFAAMLLIFVANYAYAVTLGHEDVVYVIAVLQPLMVPYSVAVIAFLWWISCRWAAGRRSRRASGSTSQTLATTEQQVASAPRGSRIWRTLADASFGVYLVHPLFIFLAMDHIIPRVPHGVPEPLLVAIVVVFAIAGSSALSVALMYTPILSRLVGRATPLPVAISRRVKATTSALRARLAVWPRARRRAIARSQSIPLLWAPPHLRVQAAPYLIGSAPPRAETEIPPTAHPGEQGLRATCPDQTRPDQTRPDLPRREDHPQHAVSGT